MKEQFSATSRSNYRPWKIIIGKARTVNVFRWQSNGRTDYSILIPERRPPRFTTTNKNRILDIAKRLSQEPVKQAATTNEVPADFMPSLLKASGRGDSDAANRKAIRAFLELLNDDPSLSNLKVADLNLTIIKRLWLGLSSANPPKVE